MKSLKRSVSLLIFGTCVRTGCRTAAPAPNILLIVIDTLRADRVEWYQSARHLTPLLDSPAAHGQVFWNAYGQSSWPSPSRERMRALGY